MVWLKYQRDLLFLPSFSLFLSKCFCNKCFYLLYAFMTIPKTLSKKYTCIYQLWLLSLGSLQIILPLQLCFLIIFEREYEGGKSMEGEDLKQIPY